jgi:hypothetical protein
VQEPEEVATAWERDIVPNAGGKRVRRQLRHVVVVEALGGEGDHVLANALAIRHIWAQGDRLDSMEEGAQFDRRSGRQPGMKVEIPVCAVNGGRH